MVRVVNEKDYAEKRNQILDAAQRLVYSKGYDQMSIQDILNELQMSKGAFYHYFGSKQALLEALIERLMQQADQFLTAIVNRPDLPALEKFQQFFSSIASWKTAQKDYLLALLRTWYADENVLFRQKSIEMGRRQALPYLTAIVKQGVAEGVFSTSYPDQIGEVAYALMLGLSEQIVDVILSPEPIPGAFERLKALVEVYTDALTRILGAPTNTLQFFDLDTLKLWVS